MATIRTFVDADVLIWAARGKDPLSHAAMNVLTSPDREFVASDFLPEVLIDDIHVDVLPIVRDAADIIWNAAGMSPCEAFDREGQWQKLAPAV